MRKDLKLNNVIFPVWMIWILPPVAIVALIGNFIIDSIVILISFIIFKVVSNTGLTMWKLYKKSILKVWFFGFLADIIGSIILSVITSSIGNNNKIIEAIYMNPFNNTWAFLIVFGAMVFACYMIYIFNYYIVFNKTINHKKIRFKVAVTIAVVTTPWTYLIPTTMFFK